MSGKALKDIVVVEALPVASETLIQPKKGSWIQHFWGTSELDIKERKYVRKVDLYLFSYIMLGYFIKSLDQTNISNAFVSGMKEDAIGIVWQRKKLPNDMVQHWHHNWHSSVPNDSVKGQLAKRVALFEQAGALSSMFSGYLQAALYTGLDGRGGLAGWKWLFIFDAIISIPIALWGFWAIPDLPHNTKAFYFSQEERDYGVQRMARIGRAGPKKLTLKMIKRIYTSWHIWAFIFPYLMVANAGLGPQFFNLWLKAEKYSVVLVNTIPTAGSALQVIFALAFGTIADVTGQRMHTANAASVLTMATNIMLAIWYIPKAALWFAFFVSFAGNAVQPVIIAWGHEITQHDAELRQLLVATGNIFTYTFSAWLPVVLFPTYDAPHYKYAYQMLIMFGGLSIVGTYLLDYLYKRELATAKTRVTESGHVVVDRSEEESDEAGTLP
ncbi:hypothetical protein B7463_g9180, partial [Scytalidium lignicola]